MKKIKTLGAVLMVMLSVIILTIIIFFGVFSNKQLLTSLTQRESQREVVFEETTIELKGFTDSKKVLYETDNAIIKISYEIAEEYFLQEIKHEKDLAEEESAVENKTHYKNTETKGEEFMNWFESQNDKNEINISNSPYISFLKNIGIETLISIQIKKGEAEVYDKKNKKNVEFIKFRVIGHGSFIIYRYYLPDGKLFFDF